MSIDLSKISFIASMNYLKRFTEGVLPVTYSVSAGGSTTESVTHNLGYKPYMSVGVDLFDDGIIWSNEYVHPYTQSASLGIDNPPNFRYWTTDTDLTVELINGIDSAVESGAVSSYYVIYLDYGS